MSAIVKTLEDDGENFDNKDIIVKESSYSEKFKFCSNCDKDAPPLQRTCRSCKSKLVRREPAIEHLNGSQKDIDPYSHFKTKPQVNNIKVLVGEPDMLNPNSFENLLTILQTLGKRASIEKCSPDDSIEKQKWLFLENDGRILNIVLKLIFNVYRCSECKEAVYGRENFDSHLCKEAYDLEPTYEFDWLIP